jgi:hypothetical protein
VEISTDFVLDLDTFDLVDLRIVIFFERFGDCLESKEKIF